MNIKAYNEKEGWLYVRIIRKLYDCKTNEGSIKR